MVGPTDRWRVREWTTKIRAALFSSCRLEASLEAVRWAPYAGATFRPPRRSVLPAASPLTCHNSYPESPARHLNASWQWGGPKQPSCIALALTLQRLFFSFGKKQGFFFHEKKLGFSLRGTPKILGKGRKKHKKSKENRKTKNEKSKEIEKSKDWRVRDYAKRLLN